MVLSVLTALAVTLALAATAALAQQKRPNMVMLNRVCDFQANCLARGGS